MRLNPRIWLFALWRRTIVPFGIRQGAGSEQLCMLDQVVALAQMLSGTGSRAADPGLILRSILGIGPEFSCVVATFSREL